MRLETVRLLTGDLDAQASFYGEVLGLRVVERTATLVVVQAGATRLAWAAAAQGWRGAYHFAFNIPKNKLAEAKRWAAERVPLIRSAAGDDEFDFANWDARAVYFYDAAGNIVELIARQALNNAAEAAFGGAQLLEVSELGLASADVPATVQLCRAALGVDVFRGSSGESFAAVGDDHGLFIIVREGRLWYPDTGVPADPLPVEATVNLGAGTRFVLSGPPYRVVPETRRA
jgi:catechol-2,3-dioxygenase